MLQNVVSKVVVNPDYSVLIQLKLVCLELNGAEDRNRTGTDVTIRGILSPLCLPVPPPRHIKNQHGAGEGNRTLVASLEG